MYDKYNLEYERPNNKQSVQIIQIFPKRHRSPPIPVKHHGHSIILSKLAAQRGGGFTAVPHYTPDTANAKAADTTRGDSRVACSECWVGCPYFAERLTEPDNPSPQCAWAVLVS